MQVPEREMVKHNWRNELANALMEKYGVPVLRVWRLTALAHGMHPKLGGYSHNSCDCTHFCRYPALHTMQAPVVKWIADFGQGIFHVTGWLVGEPSPTGGFVALCNRGQSFEAKKNEYREPCVQQLSCRHSCGVCSYIGGVFDAWTVVLRTFLSSLPLQ